MIWRQKIRGTGNGQPSHITSHCTAGERETERERGFFFNHLKAESSNVKVSKMYFSRATSEIWSCLVLN